jgi:hypothetical protein
MFTVTVKDNVAPSIVNVSTSLTSLWPPNHKMVDVLVNYTATDNCGVANTTISVTSNEPELSNENDDKAPDWQILDNHHIKLRAERLGSGHGRVYTIKIVSTDLGGNVTYKTVQVIVPHDMSDNEREKLTVTATPNPSHNYFIIDIRSNDNEKKVNIRVLNNRGVLFVVRNNLLPNQTLELGSSLPSGIYYLEAIQGNKKETIKLIKQ